MHALLVLYPRPDDPQAFRDHYVKVHVPLAAQLPGLVSYRYGFPAPLAGGEANFCVFEGVFESADAMGAALRSPIGQQVAADVPNYSPKGATMMHYEITGQ